MLEKLVTMGERSQGFGRVDVDVVRLSDRDIGFAAYFGVGWHFFHAKLI